MTVSYCTYRSMYNDRVTCMNFYELLYQKRVSNFTSRTDKNYSSWHKFWLKSEVLFYVFSLSVSSPWLIPSDRDHLNMVLQICGSPDEEMMSKIDSEDVSFSLFFLTSFLQAHTEFLLIFQYYCAGLHVLAYLSKSRKQIIGL